MSQQDAYKKFIKTIKDAKLKAKPSVPAYRLKTFVLNSLSFGLAQHRERVYILGVRQSASGLKRPLPKNPTPKISKKPELAKFLRPLTVSPGDRQLKSKTAKKNFRWASKTYTGASEAVVDCGAGKEFRQVREGATPTITRARGASRSVFLLKERRYLTLHELELLQGFKKINWPKGIPKTKRGAMIGNAMSVPVLAAAMRAVLVAGRLLKKCVQLVIS